MNTKELEAETIEKVLTTDLRDFGASIRKFMREAVKLWNEDNTNFIMSKTSPSQHFSIYCEINLS